MHADTLHLRNAHLLLASPDPDASEVESQACYQEDFCETDENLLGSTEMGEAKRRKEAVRAGLPDPGGSSSDPSKKSTRGQKRYQIRRVGNDIEIFVKSQWRRLDRGSGAFASVDQQLRAAEQQQLREVEQQKEQSGE